MGLVVVVVVVDFRTRSLNIIKLPLASVSAAQLSSSLSFPSINRQLLTWHSFKANNIVCSCAWTSREPELSRNPEIHGEPTARQTKVRKFRVLYFWPLSRRPLQRQSPSNGGGGGGRRSARQWVLRGFRGCGLTPVPSTSTHTSKQYCWL